MKAQRATSRAYRKMMRAAAKKSSKAGVGSMVAPGPGQLGFPFPGVVQEVA